MTLQDIERAIKNLAPVSYEEMLQDGGLDEAVEMLSEAFEQLHNEIGMLASKIPNDDPIRKMQLINQTIREKTEVAKSQVIEQIRAMDDD